MKTLDRFNARPWFTRPPIDQMSCPIVLIFLLSLPMSKLIEALTRLIEINLTLQVFAAFPDVLP